MYGAIEVNGTYHCLIPTKGTRVFSTVEMFPGGPSVQEATPSDDGTYLVDPNFRAYPTPTTVVKEEAIWTPGDRLAAFGTLDDCILPLPLQPEFLKIPPAVLERVLSDLSVTLTPTGAVHCVLSWGGLVIERRYDRLAVLPFGIAAWPPRALPGWKPFFLFFGEAKETDPPLAFRAFVPRVFTRSGQEQAQVKFLRDRHFALALLEQGPPAYLGLSEAGSTQLLGLTLVRADEQGLGFALTADQRRKWAETEDSAAPQATTSTLRVAIDFGTSNTAIAIEEVAAGAAAPAKPASKLLSFDQASRAAPLDPRFDPFRELDSQLLFFPAERAVDNPMQTLLYDAGAGDPGVTPFDRWSSLPKYTIPPVGAIARKEWAERAIRTQRLKQDFKWDEHPAGDLYRRAFLEQLGLLVAFQLRSQRPYEIPQAVEIRGTFPLAFSDTHTATLASAFERVRTGFESAGFENVALGNLISESYASFQYIRSVDSTIAGTSTRRVVVIDVGGGTTDISVFDGTGEALYLDSLKVGGMDLAQTLLRYRITEQGRQQEVAKAFKIEMANTTHDDFLAAVECEIIRILRSGGGAATVSKHGVRQLSQILLEHRMQDLAGEVVSLLAFVAGYAVRLALQPVPAHVRKLNVVFAGLGSTLLDLCPLDAGIMNHSSAADRLIRRVVNELDEVKHLGADLTIRRDSKAKEMVCLGAAGVRDPRDLPNLKAIWWASMPASAQVPAISWETEFDGAQARKLPDDQLESSDLGKLVEIAKASAQASAVAAFGKDWRFREGLDQDMARRLADSYQRGCTDLRSAEPGRAPHRHPIAPVMDELKRLMCSTIEPV